MKNKQEEIKGNPIQSFSDLTNFIKEDLEKVNKLIFDSLNSEEKLIPTILNNLFSSGGKRLRPILTIISARIFSYEGDKHLKLAASVECLHNATLLHDDVIDESKLRRGSPTANETWGNKASILVGDFLLSQAFRLMVESESIEILKILSNSSKIITEGEVVQLTSSNNIEVSEDTYFEIINAKTAELFSSACLVGALIASAPKEYCIALANFGRNLGLAFQITDDLLDYSVDNKLGKNYGDDFFENKVTLPALYAYKFSSSQEKDLLRKLFQKDNKDYNDFKVIYNIIYQKNIIKLVRNKIEELIKQAKLNLHFLEKNYDIHLLKIILSLIEQRI